VCVTVTVTQDCESWLVSRVVCFSDSKFPNPFHSDLRSTKARTVPRAAAVRDSSGRSLRAFGDPVRVERPFRDELGGRCHPSPAANSLYGASSRADGNSEGLYARAHGNSEGLYARADGNSETRRFLHSEGRMYACAGLTRGCHAPARAGQMHAGSVVPRDHMGPPVDGLGGSRERMSAGSSWVATCASHQGQNQSPDGSDSATWRTAAKFLREDRGYFPTAESLKGGFPREDRSEDRREGRAMRVSPSSPPYYCGVPAKWSPAPGMVCGRNGTTMEPRGAADTTAPEGSFFVNPRGAGGTAKRGTSAVSAGAAYGAAKEDRAAHGAKGAALVSEEEGVLAALAGLAAAVEARDVAAVEPLLGNASTTARGKAPRTERRFPAAPVSSLSGVSDVSDPRFLDRRNGSPVNYAALGLSQAPQNSSVRSATEAAALERSATCSREVEEEPFAHEVSTTVGNNGYAVENLSRTREIGDFSGPMMIWSGSMGHPGCARGKGPDSARSATSASTLCSHSSRACSSLSTAYSPAGSSGFRACSTLMGGSARGSWDVWDALADPRRGGRAVQFQAARWQ